MTVKAEFRLAIPGKKERTDPNDYYKVLGLDKTKPWMQSEIRAAFRAQVRRCHPDGADPDPQEFDRVQTAWSVLGDADLRERYDELPETGRWKDKFFIEEIVRKLSLSTEKPDLIKAIKKVLIKEQAEQATVWDIKRDHQQHAFYYYEDEKLPSPWIREMWVDLVKVAMWDRRLVGREIRIGTTEGTSHVVNVMWGDVYLFAGQPRMSEAQKLIAFF